VNPDSADVRYALGLYLVRKHDCPGALDLLRRPHEPAPDNAHYAYVYAVALNFDRRHCRGRRRSSRQPTISALPISEVLTAFVSIAGDKGILPRHCVTPASSSPSIPGIRRSRLWSPNSRRSRAPDRVTAAELGFAASVQGRLEPVEKLCHGEAYDIICDRRSPERRSARGGRAHRDSRRHDRRSPRVDRRNNDRRQGSCENRS